MKGLSVICPGCKRIFHETTDDFNPHRPANGSMVRLKDPWRKWGWTSFGNDGRPCNLAERSDTYWSMMDCPGCGAPLAPGGRLTVKHKDGSKFVPPPEPVPVDNTVDGKLVFDIDYSELDGEWEAGHLKPNGVIGSTSDLDSGGDGSSPSSASNTFQCPHCDFIGKNARSLAAHIRFKHKDLK